jgi:nitrite reductase/ring-hydroxylating ferredoxin subunit
LGEADDLTLLREGAEWAPAVNLAALREREVQLCYAAGHPVVVVLLDGTVYALDGRCPHWGATFVDSPLKGNAVRCPLHGFRYDVRSGVATWPEGWPPIATYATRVDDGVVYVQTAWRHEGVVGGHHQPGRPA